MQWDKAQELAASRKTEDRIRAAQFFAAQEDEAARPALLRLLSDKTHYVATLAAEALARIAPEGDLPALLDRFFWLALDGLQRDPGCHVRANLALAFGRIGSWRTVEALRIGVRTVQIEPVGGVPFDTGARLRANCALALATIGAPDALRDITLLLFTGAGNHQTVESRKAAARAMALLGERAALIPLTLRLSDAEGEMPEVLQECMQAVVALEDDRALEFLAPYLENRDRHLAAYAALMIAQTQRPEATGLILDALPGFIGDPLRAVVLALATLRTDEGQAALRELADSPRETVRLAVIEALRDSREETDRRCLQRLAKEDKSAKVRAAAQEALS